MDDLDEMKLSDRGGNEIPIQRGFPPGIEYKNYEIKNATSFYAEYDKKTMFIFQRIMIGPYPVWTSDYHIGGSSTVEVYSSLKSESIECNNMLVGKATYRLFGFKMRILRKGHGNLIYFPQISNWVRFLEYTRTCDIHLTKDQLFKLAGRHAVLQPLVASVKKKEANGLYPEGDKLSLKALWIMVRLYVHIESGNYNIADAIKLVEDFIEERCLPTHDVIKKGYAYSFEDVKNIVMAERILKDAIEKVEMPTAFHRLSKQHKDKFRTGFKIIFGVTPLKHFIMLKLDKVMELLDKKMALNEIITFVGYSEVSHLEKSFEEHIGIKIKDYKRSLQKK